MKKQLLVGALLISVIAPKLQAVCIINDTASNLRIRIYKSPNALKAYNAMVQVWHLGKNVAAKAGDAALTAAGVPTGGLVSALAANEKIDLLDLALSKVTAIIDYKLPPFNMVAKKPGKFCYNWADYLQMHMYPNLVKALGRNGAKIFRERVKTNTPLNKTLLENKQVDNLRANTKVYVAVINKDTGNPVTPTGGKSYFTVPVGGWLEFRATANGSLAYQIGSYVEGSANTNNKTGRSKVLQNVGGYLSLYPGDIKSVNKLK